MTDSLVLHFGPFSLIGRHGPLLRDGAEIKLQPKTLALLWTLARQAGDVITKSALTDAVWPGVIVGEEALTFQIHALRRALEDDPKSPQYILTAHRIGFRFAAAVRTTADTTEPTTTHAFVGRQAEISRLYAMLDKTRRGQRQIVFVSGEAGIGKTKLVSEFLSEAVRSYPNLMIGRGQCVEHQGTAEAYLPVLDALGHLLRHAPDDQLIDVLRRIAPGWLLQWPSLIRADEYAALKRQARGASRERMLRELAEALEQLSAKQPLVLVLEDLHWGDTATLDLLTMLAPRSQAAQLMVVVTYRPVDAILAEHPVRALQLKLRAGQQASELLLGYLDGEAVALYLQHRLGKQTAPPELVQTLYMRSGGHPLFLAQLFDYLAPQGQSISADLAAIEAALPQGLRDLIALQMAQLSADERQILEVASIAGMEFAAASVAAGAGLTAESVEHYCDRLAQQGQFIEDHGLAIWPDGTSSGRYQFRHVLYKQALAQGLTSARRARLHRQIADQLETAFGERTREIAGELANHYEQAGTAEKTVRYCIVLTGIALERAAQSEAEIQAERGLRWLTSVPAGAQRDEHELNLRTAIAIALQARLGNHCTAALSHLAVVEQLIPAVSHAGVLEQALAALWRANHFQGRYEQALLHAEKIRNLGQTLASPVLASCGHAWSSHTLNMMGRHADAHTEALLGVEQAANAIQLQPRMLALESGCAAHGALAIAIWYLGYPDQSLQAAREASSGAARIGNPYAQCLIQSVIKGNILLSRRDWDALKKHSIECITLSEHYGHEDSFLLSTQHRLIASTMLGDSEDDLIELLALLARERGTGGTGRNLISGHVHAAEAAVLAGRPDRAHEANQHAMALVESLGMRPWEPEIWRVRAEILLAEDADNIAEAEECLHRAVAMSRERRGRSLELRAANGLAQLWRSQHRARDALNLIQPLYEGFTEGFDAPDLMQAKALIESLTASLERPRQKSR